MKTANSNYQMTSLRRFVESLGYRSIQRRRTFSSPAQLEEKKLVSVFVIMQVKETRQILIQKVARKAHRGFPGGTIEESESILEAAAREVIIETGKPLGGGIDIAPYEPITLGDFELSGSLDSERGIVVYVEIPQTELENIVLGNTEEGETIEGYWKASAKAVRTWIDNRELTSNSVKAFFIFENYFRTIV